MRKIKIVFLTVAIFINSLTGVSFAENPNIVNDITEDILVYPTGLCIEEKEYTETNPRFLENAAEKYAAADYTSLYSYLEEQCLNHAEKIDIRSYNIPASDIFEIYCRFAMTHPELLIKTKLQYSKSLIFKKTLTIMPEYLFQSVSEDDAARKIMQDKLNKYVAVAANCPDTLSKILYIHDEVIKNCKYDRTYSESAYHAYGIFGNNTAVCQGYSQAFYMIAKALGIESDFCISENENHMWKYVKISDSWYHIDLTWDDPIIKDKNGNIVERTTAYHDNFLLSDKSMEKIHSPKAEWQTYLSDKPDCVATNYEKEYIFNAPTPFSVVNLSGKTGFTKTLSGKKLTFLSENLHCGKLLVSQPVSANGINTVYFYKIGDISNQIYAYTGTYKNNKLCNIEKSNKGILQESLLYKHEFYSQDSGTETKVFIWDSKSTPYSSKITIKN